MTSRDFVNSLEKNNNLEAEDAFKNAMKIKMSDAIDLKKREVASSIVTKTNKSEEDNAQETEWNTRIFDRERRT